MEKEEKPKTLRLSIIISLILSISILIVILYFTLREGNLDELKNVNLKYEFFFAALGINILYYFAWGARLRALSNAFDKKVRISLWESTKIIITNMFLANITPSMAGGEPVRIYLLNKNGLSTGSATAAVLAERLLDAIFLLICLPFAFIIFRNNFQNDLLRNGLTIAVALFIIVILAFAYSIKNPEKIKNFLIWINNKLSRFSKKTQSKKNIVTKINREVDNFHDSMVYLVTSGKVAFLKAFILTALFWMIGWLLPISILLGLGLPPHILESSAAQILLIIIVMMPTTPGSAGITEGGTAALYSVFIPGSFVGVFTILFRLFGYYIGLILGAIFQYRIFKSISSFSMSMIKKKE